MRFITEEELRILYKKEPFTTFALAGDRLTPGARQFLIDRRVAIADGSSPQKGTLKSSQGFLERKNNWRSLKLNTMLGSIQGLFLLTEEELLKTDLGLAQKVIYLNRQLSKIRESIKDKSKVESIGCADCDGINGQNFAHYLEDCFEITEFHMQLEKGKAVLLLHQLRATLREIEPIILEICSSTTENHELWEDTIGKINEIINSLSQLICSIAGGKRCQN